MWWMVLASLLFPGFGQALVHRKVRAIAWAAAAIVTLTVNMSANVVSPSYDFSNVAPHRISRRTGGLLVGFLGVVSMPWKLLDSPSGFIFNWLGGYGGGMGAIAGVMIVDYWIVRRGQLRLNELFSAHGVYSYTGGWNLRAVAATAVGLFLAWGGYVIPGRPEDDADKGLAAPLGKDEPPES